MSSYISVYITCPGDAEAERIGRALVTEKLAACVNILPSARSMYRWQGTIEETEETIMIVKSRAELFEPLKNLVKTLHSQSCPCIVATPLTQGHPPYFAWISKETT